MPTACTITGCKFLVPAELEAERVCLAHFLVRVDQACAEMRRETVMGKTSAERRAEIIAFIASHGDQLARVSTSGLRISDELKGHVLNTFLTLINLRENLDRAAQRAAPK